MTWENPWEGSTNVFWRLRTFPSYLVWSLAGFVSGWVQTRRLGFLFLGLPALVVAIFVVSFAFRSQAGINTETVRRYTEACQFHLQNNRIKEAEFYLSRLNEYEFPDDRLLVTRAEMATRNGRPDLAESCYQKMLTNSDQALDGLAHKQLAMADLQAATDPQGPRAADAIRHLQETIKSSPNDLSSYEMLAKIYLSRGDLNSVVQYLEPVAQQNPGVQIELARYFEKLGRQSKKVDAAKKAEAYFASAVPRIDSEKDHSSPEWIKKWTTGYLEWSESLMMQGKLNEAIQVVTPALDQHHSPELRRRLATIYVRKINALPTLDNPWPQRWELVSLSRNYDPDASESLVILANIAAHAPHDLRQLAQREIQPYLDTGQAPPAAYYMLGTAAATDNQWETALSLLRKAIEVEPRADIAWNNLARVLYSQPQPDWTEAERSINEAIRLNSAPAQYHETRGQVMVGLQRWAEAVRELELALQGMPPQAKIHQGLAIAYRELGDEDLADHHRTRQSALTQR